MDISNKMQMERKEEIEREGQREGERKTEGERRRKRSKKQKKTVELRLFPQKNSLLRSRSVRYFSAAFNIGRNWNLHSFRRSYALNHYQLLWVNAFKPRAANVCTQLFLSMLLVFLFPRINMITVPIH